MTVFSEVTDGFLGFERYFGFSEFLKRRGVSWSFQFRELTTKLCQAGKTVCHPQLFLIFIFAVQQRSTRLPPPRLSIQKASPRASQHGNIEPSLRLLWLRVNSLLRVAVTMLPLGIARCRCMHGHEVRAFFLLVFWYDWEDSPVR